MPLPELAVVLQRNLEKNNPADNGGASSIVGCCCCNDARRLIVERLLLAVILSGLRNRLLAVRSTRDRRRVVVTLPLLPMVILSIASGTTVQ